MTETSGFYNISQSEKQKFLVKTYLWMALALFVTAASAFYTASSQTLLMMIFSSRFGYLILALAEIGLVMALSANIRKIGVSTARIMFLLYSVLNGMTLSSIFFIYQLGSIAGAFAGTSVLFLMMAVYGAVTKQDLTKAAHYLMMALLGIVIVSLFNHAIRFFTHSPSGRFDWIISIATVVVFTGLTAYDSQKILRAASHAQDSDDFKKVAVIGALELYLDFINIFLALLRLFGRGRD